MATMSQGNKKITTIKIPATNNKVLQFALFQEIPATNYKILVGPGPGTRDSSNKISELCIKNDVYNYV